MTQNSPFKGAKALICVLALAAIAAGLLVWWQTARRHPGAPSNQTVAIIPTSPHVADPLPRETLTPVQRSDIANLPDPVSASAEGRTVVDLISKGLPPASKPREDLRDRTSQMSIAEATRDIGNAFTLSILESTSDNSHGANDIRYWRLVLPRHVTLLYLMEKAEQDRTEVLAQAHAAIADSIAAYEDLRLEYDVALREWLIDKTREPDTLYEDDAFYAEHQRYEDPIHELGRRHAMVYGSLYLLANLEALPQEREALAVWSGLKKHREYHNDDMDIWIAHHYFRQAPRSPGADVHRELIGDHDKALSGKVTVSTWDAGWDIHEPMLTAVHIDTGGIPTVDVLQIPKRIPLDHQTKQAVLDNFRRHLGQH